jgi:hypothetical protein
VATSNGGGQNFKRAGRDYEENLSISICYILARNATPKAIWGYKIELMNIFGIFRKLLLSQIMLDKSAWNIIKT